MRQAGALEIGADVDAVGQALEALLAHPSRRDRMAAAGAALVESGRGALDRTLALIAQDLPPVSA
jgi:3-deoxy-D-manno-octulosonic-acid transferase